jgi:RimJ/RimL family protein N-acetyltransferase
MNKQTLTSSDIVLRPLEDRDIPSLIKWSEDAGLRRLIGEVVPMDWREAEAFLGTARSDPSREWYVVALRDGSAIGEAGLLRIFPAWLTADVSVVIGEAGERGKGYGT